jgi:hypothetical protein
MEWWSTAVMEGWSGGVLGKNISVHSQAFVGWVEARPRNVGFRTSTQPTIYLSSMN